MSKTYPCYSNITKKWGNSRFRKIFDEKLNEWISQFTESEKPLVINLLMYFMYYTEQSFNKRAVDLHRLLCDKYNEVKDKAVYTSIYKQYGVGFSDIFFLYYWKNNDLYDQSCNDIFQFLEHNSIPEVLVIIDDYFGTGQTFIKMVTRMINCCPDIIKTKIFFLTLHGTRTGQKNILNFADQNSISITVLFLDLSDEAFKEDYIYPINDVNIAKNNYISICKRFNVNSNYILGYQMVQSLVAFDYNTPNNTLGLFWHENDNYKFLFKRHKKTRTTLSDLKSKCMQKKHINNLKPVIYKNIDDNKYKIFMIYCIGAGSRFSFTKACKDFGYSPSKIFYILNYLVKNNYLKHENGVFILDDSIENHVFKTRIKSVFEAFKEPVSEPLKNDNMICAQVSYIPTDFNTRFNGYKNISRR